MEAPMPPNTSRPSPLMAADLTAEANHRIANHLGMLAALMRLQGKGLSRKRPPLSGEEVHLLLEEFAIRLETVGEIHRLLAGSSGVPIDVAAYLRTIAHGLVSSLTADDKTTIQCRFPPTCVLPAEQAVALGLLVSELITNALKYAHPAGVPGAIAILASRPDDGTIAIEVADDGVGLPDGLDPLRSDSLGLRTIRLLAKQLGASISFDNHGLGLSCLVQIPCAGRVLKAVS